MVAYKLEKCFIILNAIVSSGIIYTKDSGSGKYKSLDFSVYLGKENNILDTIVEALDGCANLLQENQLDLPKKSFATLLINLLTFRGISHNKSKAYSHLSAIMPHSFGIKTPIWNEKTVPRSVIVDKVFSEHLICMNYNAVRLTKNDVTKTLLDDLITIYTNNTELREYKFWLY